MHARLFVSKAGGKGIDGKIVFRSDVEVAESEGRGFESCGLGRNQRLASGNREIKFGVRYRTGNFFWKQGNKVWGSVQDGEFLLETGK